MTAGPAVEPVTLFETKAQLRVDTDDEDVLLAAMIRAARVRCEQYTRRAFVTQTIRYTLDCLPEFDSDWLTSERSIWADVELPRPPFQSLVAVTYATDTQEAIPLAPGSYRVSGGAISPLDEICFSLRALQILRTGEMEAALQMNPHLRDFGQWLSITLQVLNENCAAQGLS